MCSVAVDHVHWAQVTVCNCCCESVDVRMLQHPSAVSSIFFLLYSTAVALTHNFSDLPVSGSCSYAVYVCVPSFTGKPLRVGTAGARERKRSEILTSELSTQMDAECWERSDLVCEARQSSSLATMTETLSLLAGKRALPLATSNAGLTRTGV